MDCKPKKYKEEFILSKFEPRIQTHIQTNMLKVTLLWSNFTHNSSMGLNWSSHHQEYFSSFLLQDECLGSLSCYKIFSLSPRRNDMPLPYGVVFMVIKISLHSMKIIHSPNVTACPDHHVSSPKLH